MALIYLICSRKNWHYELSKDWIEIYHERHDYVECGIFSKPNEDLTIEDKELIENHGRIPEGWIGPRITENITQSKQRMIPIGTCEPCPYRDHRGGYGNPRCKPYCTQTGWDLPYVESKNDPGYPVAQPTYEIPVNCPLPLLEPMVMESKS